jgi:hypothetical protein
MSSFSPYTSTLHRSTTSTTTCLQPSKLGGMERRWMHLTGLDKILHDIFTSWIKDNVGHVAFCHVATIVWVTRELGGHLFKHMDVQRSQGFKCWATFPPLVGAICCVVVMKLFFVSTLSRPNYSDLIKKLWCAHCYAQWWMLYEISNINSQSNFQCFSFPDRSNYMTPVPFIVLIIVALLAQFSIRL